MSATRIVVGGKYPYPIVIGTGVLSELSLLVGSYALAWTLGKTARRSMTETVKAWRDFPPGVLPLPHPSWRNTAWLRRNPWFDAELAPYVRQRVAEILAS